MLGAGLAVALLLCAPSVDLELGVRTEARGSRLSPSAGNRAPQYRASAEVTPALGVSVGSATWRVRTAYAPRFWSPDLEDDRRHLDQQVILNAEVHPDPGFRLGLLATGVRGTLDPLADPWSDFATSTLPTPSPGVQPYESARGVFDGLVRIAGATTFSTTATATWSGGTTTQARLLLPPQRTLNATVRLDQGIGARTLVGVLWDATVARTWPAGLCDPAHGMTAGCDTETGYTFVALRLDRSFTRDTRGWISIGANALRETSRARDEAIQGLAPGGEIGLSHFMIRTGLTSTGVVRAAPEIDRLTGEARRTVSTTLTLAISPVPRWTLRLDASGSVTTPGRDPAVAGAELRAQRRFENGFQLEGGVRARRQRDSRFELGTFSEAGAFVALDWSLERTRPARPTGAPAAAPAR